ncbi:hypothetical protein GOP47_0008634 [Adiantum capillus-veneris]|uniref:Uncharacterized protein n=1 Tax=Adiantum capillus-veneris TaxID=13818 RepID=A0A9D4ZID1_ADICA|nr:hypothetical protein GOP47_0008634 [Adiantum capillus-veneris]
MTDKWVCQVEGKEAIDVAVAEEFRNLTADIIANTAFGSSFAEGKLVFELQHKQQELFSKLNAAGSLHSGLAASLDRKPHAFDPFRCFYMPMVSLQPLDQPCC